MLTLRTLSCDDWPLWRDLRLQALKEAPYAFSSTFAQWEHAQEDQWRHRLTIPQSINFIACYAEAPVGMATCLLHNGEFEVISMWMTPKIRGTGASSMLLDACSQWAKEQGAQTICLDVKEDNDRAMAFYKRYGFIDSKASEEAGERRMTRHI